MFLTFDNVHNVIVQAVPNFNVCLKAFSQVTTGPSLRDLNSRLDDVAFQMRTFRFKIYNYRQHWQWQPVQSHPFVATPQNDPIALCRPNFVVEGSDLEPWSEDCWTGELKIGDTELVYNKPCTRCQSTRVSKSKMCARFTTSVTSRWILRLGSSTRTGSRWPSFARSDNMTSRAL